MIMSRRKSPKVKAININSAIVIAVIGLIGTAITAYFGYLAIVKPTQLAISATQTAAVPGARETARSIANAIGSANFPISYLPIPNKDELIKSFKLEGTGERVQLRFIANKFEIDFNFSAPLSMTCDALIFHLTEQLSLDKYLRVDQALFEGTYGTSWNRTWMLVINGTALPYSQCERVTLRILNLHDGDLIGLGIQWILDGKLAAHPTSTPALTPVKPPIIFP
jgi:hypothetical protein